MSDQKHIMECNSCGRTFDMRDLGDVFHHAFNECLNGTPAPSVQYSSSIKLGEPVEYLNTPEKTPLTLN